MHAQSLFSAPLTVFFGFWMLTFNWVLIPSYQGTLLSFFSIPFTQKPIDTLDELRLEMQLHNKSLGKQDSFRRRVKGLVISLQSSFYYVGVTDGSSSFGIISTGGGIYQEIWKQMQSKGDWEISSVKKGLQR